MAAVAKTAEGCGEIGYEEGVARDLLGVGDVLEEGGGNVVEVLGEGAGPEGVLWVEFCGV